MKRLVSFAAAVICGLMVGIPWAQAPKPAGLNDPQIVGVVAAVNQMDVDLARLVQSRTKNKDVSALAQQLLSDHSAADKQVSALTTKLEMKPTASDLSQRIKLAAVDVIRRLMGLKGPEFDRAYVAHEVENHQAILNIIDSTLIPNAGNADVGYLLSQLRPAIAKHLEHAKHIQQMVKG